MTSREFWERAAFAALSSAATEGEEAGDVALYAAMCAEKLTIIWEKRFGVAEDAGGK